MKAFAVVLLCLVAAVQGRSAGAQEPTAAALGENPWVVHLRVAVSTSGFLNTCAGTLLGDAWVLTTASCVTNVRFIWIRYGTVDVIRPQLVTEASSVRFHPDYNAETGANDVALVNINRSIDPTEYVSPVSLPAAGGSIPASAQYCGYGATENSINPGEKLRCIKVEVETAGDDLVVTAADGVITEFDVGASLVVDGVQYGILRSAPSGDDSKSKFVNIFNQLDWINDQIGVVPNSDFGAALHIVD